MRVGLVTQWYPPEVPGLIAPAMAHGLAELGHEVHVVTGVPNYPTGVVYPGYRVRAYSRERDGDVVVHRGALYPSHDRSAARRAANYISFALGSMVPGARVPAPDVWLTNGTPVTADFCSMVYSSLRRAAHVQIVQDLWPDSMMRGGLFTANGLFARSAGAIMGRVSLWSYRSCDRIGVISPGMREVLVKRGVRGSRVVLTPNSVADDHLYPSIQPTRDLKRRLGLPEGRIFMYAGNFGHAQNLERLVRTFARVPNANLVLIGDGSSLDRLRALASESSNVFIRSRRVPSEIGEFLAASDVQIVSLLDDPLYNVTMPSKFQAALAAGRPVLAHAAGDVAKVVAERRVGWPVRLSDDGWRDVNDILSRSDEELRVIGARARDVYERVYSPGAGAKRLEGLLEGAVADRRQRRAA